VARIALVPEPEEPHYSRHYQNNTVAIPCAHVARGRLLYAAQLNSPVAARGEAGTAAEGRVAHVEVRGLLDGIEFEQLRLDAALNLAQDALRRQDFHLALQTVSWIIEGRSLLSRSQSPQAQPAATLPTGVSGSLSQRQQDVLKLIGSGLSNKQIALSLNIAPETVKSHAKSIFAKLEVKSRTEAAVRAQQYGIL
jgi:ATP/maltotriose-dependent transcriptional regulator MalT